MSAEKDIPGVIVFPPLIPLGVLVIGVLLDWLAPLSFLSSLPSAARIVVGVALLALGLAGVIAGERAFKRIGTNINPMQPALAIAESGVFAHIRNPMYVGGSAAILGIILLFGLEWTLLLLVLGSLVLHFGVVLREERYLERKFGDEYRRYKERVPRYGWKL